jgi:hypothetical protein
MAGALRAVAGGLAAAEGGEAKRVRKQVVRKLETTHELKLALAEPRGPGALRCVFHLMV